VALIFDDARVEPVLEQVSRQIVAIVEDLRKEPV
jgi:hypothetical protein